MSKTNEYKILYLDIETSPNYATVWRPGWSISVGHQNIIEERQIILASYAWNDSKPATVTWEPDNKSPNKYLRYSDKNVVKAIIDEMDKADLIVTQNGDAFDIKWVRGRGMKHGIPMAPVYQTFDTLKKSRQLLNINSKRLDYLGQFFLGEGKVNTGGFQLWLDCISGCQKAMKRMQKYCEGDVRLLRRYYKYLMNYAAPNHHVGASLGFNADFTCATCGTHDIRKSKEYHTKAGALRVNMKCANGHYTTVSHASYLRFLKNKER